MGWFDFWRPGAMHNGSLQWLSHMTAIILSGSSTKEKRIARGCAFLDEKGLEYNLVEDWVVLSGDKP